MGSGIFVRQKPGALQVPKKLVSVDQINDCARGRQRIAAPKVGGPAPSGPTSAPALQT